jgi:hypothetical protein
MGSVQAHASPVSEPPQCGGPYAVGWLCDETDYLAKLGRDGATVHHHAAAVMNVGYRVCPRLHRPQ